MLKRYINHPLRHVVVIGALFVSLPALSSPVAAESLERACGEVSYNTAGGSLVINDSVVVTVADRTLWETLVSEVELKPVSLCLLGRWLQQGRVFNAVEIAD